MADSGPPYQIGYRKPPQARQFKKGISGNPSGRPKGSRSLHTIVSQAARDLVVVNGPKGQRRITKIDATIIQLANKAAQGNLPASRDFIELYRASEQSALAQTSASGYRETDRAVLESLQKRLKQSAADQTTTTMDKSCEMERQ